MYFEIDDKYIYYLIIMPSIPTLKGVLECSHLKTSLLNVITLHYRICPALGMDQLKPKSSWITLPNIVRFQNWKKCEWLSMIPSKMTAIITMWLLLSSGAIRFQGNHQYSLQPWIITKNTARSSYYWRQWQGFDRKREQALQHGESCWYM